MKMLGEGKSAIFITHKMDEVIEFSHKVQVLRRGKTVNTCDTSTVTPKDLANMMVGRDVLFSLDRCPFNPGGVKLKVENVTVKNPLGSRPFLDNVSLEIHRGEIVGIAGVAGNGQTQLTEVITGLLPVTEGKIFIDGKEMTNATPLQVIRAGVSHIPADRGANGVVGDMSVGDNLAMKRLLPRIPV
jgi:simple sugar transport system ATP-binding protein